MVPVIQVFPQVPEEAALLLSHLLRGSIIIGKNRVVRNGDIS